MKHKKTWGIAFIIFGIVIAVSIFLPMIMVHHPDTSGFYKAELAGAMATTGFYSPLDLFTMFISENYDLRGYSVIAIIYFIAAIIALPLIITGIVLLFSNRRKST
ncbi:MAG: hypothetical protein FWE45_01895 [Firmicutes bacterium]|nr:hypothetical protein [Bacillota bacterium]